MGWGGGESLWLISQAVHRSGALSLVFYGVGFSSRWSFILGFHCVMGICSREGRGLGCFFAFWFVLLVLVCLQLQLWDFITLFKVNAQASASVVLSVHCCDRQWCVRVCVLQGCGYGGRLTELPGHQPVPQQLLRGQRLQEHSAMRLPVSICTLSFFVGAPSRPQSLCVCVCLKWPTGWQGVGHTDQPTCSPVPLPLSVSFFFVPSVFLYDTVYLFLSIRLFVLSSSSSLSLSHMQITQGIILYGNNTNCL